MGLGKVNRVTTDFTNYVHLILGSPKVGKTTLVAKVVEELTGDIGKGLFVEIGDETGYELLDGLVYEAPQSFTEIDEIVDEFLEGNHDFDYIVMDTINEWAKCSDEQTLVDHHKSYGEKAPSVNGAFGGYGNGAKHSIGLYSSQLKDLKASKYGVFLIGHNKVKGQKEKNGEEYNVITSDLFSNYYSAFSKKASIICNIIPDRSIDESGNLEEENRIMYFRDDGFVKAGTRINEIKPSAPYGADNYISVVKEGIENSKKANHQPKHAEEFEEVKNSKALKLSLDEYKDRILSVVEEIQEKLDDAGEEIMSVLGENDVQNPNDIEEKEVAEKVYNGLKDLL